jgi:type IV pilus assembly protein PilN
MIKINLLPFRAARKKENIRKQMSIYILSIIAIILLLTYFIFMQTSKANALKEKDKQLKAELATLEKVEKEIKQMEKEIKEIEQKLDVIKELDNKKTGPVHLLDELSMAIPKDKLWIVSVNEMGGLVKLKGVAMDNETVALFMNNLEKSNFFTNVELEGTKSRDIASYHLRVSDFSLNCKTTTPKVAIN